MSHESIAGTGRHSSQSRIEGPGSAPYGGGVREDRGVNSSTLVKRAHEDAFAERALKMGRSFIRRNKREVAVGEQLDVASVLPIAKQRNSHEVPRCVVASVVSKRLLAYLDCDLRQRPGHNGVVAPSPRGYDPFGHASVRKCHPRLGPRAPERVHDRLSN